MNSNDIAAILAEAVGNPSVGPIAEAIPTMAAALDQALNPKPTKETRVITTKETRNENEDTNDDT